MNKKIRELGRNKYSNKCAYYGTDKPDFNQ